MNRCAGFTLFAVLVLAGASALARQPAPPPALEGLSWMAGSWAGTLDGIEMEEHWTRPKGNSMIGMHRDVGRGRTLVFEFLRIEQQGGAIVYLSMPNGRSPATRFPLKEAQGARVVFENLAHDFPQRIIYWKDGADLRARIEGTQNGKASGAEWRWQPAGTPK
jgi:hypothetical protein